MKKLGIFICNYNKQNYVVSCVQSVLKQENVDFDLYVVDNASTDDSVEILQNKYGSEINIIVNEENLGGSGGFNTGLRIGLEKGYDYIMLVDNDVIMDTNTVYYLKSFLENNNDVGIVGPVILQYQHPDLIQDFGGSIQLSDYTMKGKYYDEKECSLPLIEECDYVSTCTAMVRSSALRKFGLMPEDNFIYWDDVEWSTKCRLNGFKTAAYSKGRVWHNHSIVNGKTPFVQYYLTRNRLNYFAKYLQDDQLDQFKQRILDELFSSIYGCTYKGWNSIAKATISALEDCIQNVRGKAKEGTILPKEEPQEPFRTMLKNNKKLVIEFWNPYPNSDQYYHLLLLIIAKIYSVRKDAEVFILLEEDIDRNEFKVQLSQMNDDILNHKIIDKQTITNKMTEFLTLRICEHVKNVEADILPTVWIDGYCNCILTQQHYDYFKRYNSELSEFMKKYKLRFDEAITQLRV